MPQTLDRMDRMKTLAIVRTQAKPRLLPVAVDLFALPVIFFKLKPALRTRWKLFLEVRTLIFRLVAPVHLAAMMMGAKTFLVSALLLLLVMEKSRYVP